MHTSISNQALAALFSEMADLLELAGGNLFRVKAYRGAALTVAGLQKEAVSMPEEELLEVKGIGKGIASHIAEISSKGAFAELEAMRAKFPKGLLDLLGVEGIGAKRARLLFEKLGVDSLTRLREKAAAGEIRGLEGFGAKVEAKIVRALESGASSGPQRTLYWPALKAAGEIVSAVKQLGGKDPVFAGSLRRGLETVGDLDILCLGRMDGVLTGKFAGLPEVERTLAAGKTKATVLLKSGMQCDLRVVPPESYGAALAYFTGSKSHNVLLRELALKKGFTLSEYGLFRLSDKEKKRPVASRSEEDIYRALGLQFVPPELREGRGELALAAAGKLPELVTLGDIRGDLHNHTTLSDGADTMADMLAAARGLGWDWMFVGDHTRSLGVVHGLDYAAYARSRAELAKAVTKIPKFSAGRSLEMEISRKGELEYSDGDIKNVDLVIGAVHSALKSDVEKRLIAAMGNPCADIIAHASGRLLGRREAAQLDYASVFAEAARRGTAFEINGQPERQDLTDVTARQASEAGVKLALTTDAHSAGQLEYIRQAVTVARRAGLTRKDVLNSMSFAEVKEWVRERRAKASRVR